MTRGIRPILVWAAAAAALMTGPSSRASVLGLADGTYNLTLSCSSAGCGGPFSGSLTVVGADVTAWDVTVLADTLQSFIGNPTEQLLGPPTDLEFVRGPGVNAVYGLELRFGPSGPPSRSWGVDITGVEVNRGIWSAVPVTIAIPLPSALLLTGTGLAALGLSRTRRR